MERKLTGIFIRVKRDGKWENNDFTDLTEQEMNDFLNRRLEYSIENLQKSGEVDKYSTEMVSKDEYNWVRNLAIKLANCIKTIGEEFDIITNYEI